MRLLNIECKNYCAKIYEIAWDGYEMVKPR
jgi:hypothetical protein